MSDFFKYASNPKAYTLKKWFSELLKEDYLPFNDVVERLATVLATEKDLQDCGRLITTIYERAYRKAVDDYREEFEKLGVTINIVPRSN
jgi:hypothetical protein